MATPSVPTEEVVDLSPFKRMVMTIGTLPTAFTDSMTYYEALAYFVKYLEETVIPAVNQNAEATKELQRLFTELKSYVDNYFENLDVQDEIDHKLDEMVESGEFQTIIAAYIAAYIQLNGLIMFDTVSDMKSGDTYQAGSIVKTLGYRATTSGGGAYYMIRAKVEGDDPDEMTLISLDDDSLVAQLVFDDISINPIQLGAYGDGIHDDSIYFQKAIDIASTSYLRVEVDDKDYVIGQTLEINNDNFTLDCAGRLFITDDITLLSIHSRLSHIYIKSIIAPAETPYIGTGILLTGYSYMNDIFVENILRFNKGISLDVNNSTDGIQYNKIKFNYLNATYGIYMNANGYWINQNYFYGGIVNGTYCVYSAAITGDDGEYNGNIFYDLGFEQCVTPITLNDAYCNGFYNFRMMEASITGTTFISLTNCKNNLFKSPAVYKVLTATKISDNITTPNDANIFECMISNPSSTGQYAMKSVSFDNLIKPIDNLTLPTMKYIENTDYNTSSEKICAYNQFVILNNSGTTHTITLDSRYYNPYNTSFMVRISNPQSTSNIIIKDSRNRTILDVAGQISSGKITAGTQVDIQFNMINNQFYPFYFR